MRRLALVEALAVVALALSASSGLAQRSAPMPDYTTLRLGVDTLEVHVVRGGERRRTGVIVDAIDTVRSGGELRLVRTYRTIDLVLGTSLDTIIDEAARLVPRYSSRSSGRSSDALTWSNGRITGFVAELGKSRRSIDEGGADSVFNGATVDLILRASPLADGYAVTIPTFSGAQGLNAVSARVAGSESVGGIDSWRVDASFADLPVTFWIEKVSRRLVRQVMRPAEDVEIEFIRADANRTRRVATRGQRHSSDGEYGSGSGWPVPSASAGQQESSVIRSWDSQLMTPADLLAHLELARASRDAGTINGRSLS